MIATKTAALQTVWVVKQYRRHGKLWIVYRYRNGRRFKQCYRA